MPDKTLINVWGHICSGKSTVVDALMKKHRGIYCVDFDVIKLQLSGYYWRDDRELATSLTCEFLNVVCSTGRPVVSLLPQPRGAARYESYVAYAKAQGYRVINIYMTAPEEVLTRRYQERLNSVTRRVKTLEEFQASLGVEIYQPAGTLRLDSSEQSAGELLGQIEAHISQSQ